MSLAMKWKAHLVVVPIVAVWAAVSVLGAILGAMAGGLSGAEAAPASTPMGEAGIDMPGLERSLGWDFSQGTHGFAAINGVAPLRVIDGALRVSVIGFDPYVHSPPVDLVGERDRWMHVRLRATQGEQLKIYFTTPTGGWAESRSIAFPIVADGEYRDYWFDLFQHPGWRGPITQFRFDLEPADTQGAQLDIQSVQFYRVGPALNLAGLRFSRGSVYPGEQVTVYASLANAGGEPIDALSWRLVVPEGLEVTGVTQDSLDRLALSATIPLEWTVTAQQAGSYAMELELESDTLGRSRFVIPLVVSSPAPDPSALEGGRGVRFDGDGHVVLEQEEYRVVFVRSPHGYTQGVVYGARGEEWLPLAVIPPASLIIEHEEGREQIVLVPTEAALFAEDRKKAGLTLAGSVQDRTGTTWTFELTFEASAASEWVETRYRVTPDRPARLLLFDGPQLLVGERSFGSTKESALFPGLEWLTAEESSSSTLDAHPPIHLRVAPHPLKVTVPHMAVLAEGYLVGLMWDPLQEWAPGETMPTARFASPNWLYEQENHLMALSVPSIDQWVRENEVVAHTPYRVEAGETLSIQAQLTVAQTDDVLAAMDLYFKRYGVPDPGEPPRSWEEQRRLMAHAYMESYWIAEAQGWGHVYGWEPQPFPGHNEVLRMLADREPDPDRRRAMLERVDEVTLAGLLKHDLGWLGTSAGGHITLRTLPYYQGYVLQALDTWSSQVRGQMASQQSDGHWVFTPSSDPAHQALGKAGEKALGLTATPAWDILRYARVTGDAAATAAGLKALEAMREFRVPRAAQTWEVPVHSPDILAAAKAIGAYVEGYRLTGDPAYLEDAKYWARSGLPFVYVWGAPDRPVMKYATIAAFGATHYVLPWFGRPVQWNGLVYAYHLMELSEYDPSFPWDQVAKGIVLSAMRQQRTVEPARGGFPDVWELVPNRPILNVDINPETIAKPAFYVFEGQSPDIRTVVVDAGERAIRLNAVAAIEDVEWTGDRLRFRLPYIEGTTTHALVIGLGRPLEVRIDGVPISETRWYEREQQGWNYRTSRNGGELVIKLRHSTESRVEIIYETANGTQEVDS